MTEDDIIARARRARAFLAHEDTQQAFADLALDVFNEWTDTAWDEAAKRERLSAEQRALQRLAAKFQQWANDLTLREIDH